jgi:DNA-binding response OmpR family regulator
MKKIILAIDDDLLREVYGKKLMKSNFKVFPVQTRKEIFAALEKEKIDLILIDVSLENVKGIEILKEIREKKKIDLPVIVFSVLKEEDLKEKAKKMKAKEFLVGTEISPNELVKKIKNILK